jgi:hypothetical protein
MPAHFADWIGAIGELLNFVGALILARDLFLRRKEASEIKRLNRLGQWGRKHALSAEYEHVSVGDPEFTDKVLDRRASVLGYWGIGFMALGFLALVASHLIAIHGE